MELSFDGKPVPKYINSPETVHPPPSFWSSRRKPPGTGTRNREAETSFLYDSFRPEYSTSLKKGSFKRECCPLEVIKTQSQSRRQGRSTSRQRRASRSTSRKRRSGSQSDSGLLPPRSLSRSAGRTRLAERRNNHSDDDILLSRLQAANLSSIPLGSDEEIAELERLLLMTGKSPTPIKKSSKGPHTELGKLNFERDYTLLQTDKEYDGPTSPTKNLQNSDPPKTPLNERKKKKAFPLRSIAVGTDPPTPDEPFMPPDPPPTAYHEISESNVANKTPVVNSRQAISSLLDQDSSRISRSPRQVLSPKFSKDDPLDKMLIPPGEFETEVRGSYNDAMRMQGKRLMKTRWDRQRQELREEARRKLHDGIARQERFMLERVRREGFTDIELARIETELTDRKRRLKKKMESEHNQIVDLMTQKVLEQRESHLDEERMAMVNSFSVSTSDLLRQKQHELKSYSERRLQALQRRLEKEQALYLESERRRMRADTEAVLEATSQKLLTDRRQSIHNLREKFMADSRKLLHDIEREARKQHAHMGESLVEMHRAKRWGEHAKLEETMQSKVTEAVQRIQTRVDMYASRGEEVLKQEAAAELQSAIHKLRVRILADNEEHLYHISCLFEDELRKTNATKMSLEDFNESAVKVRNEAQRLSQAFEEMKIQTRLMGQKFVDLTVERVLLDHDLSNVANIGSLWKEESKKKDPIEASGYRDGGNNGVAVGNQSKFKSMMDLSLSKDYWKP